MSTAIYNRYSPSSYSSNLTAATVESAPSDDSSIDGSLESLEEGQAHDFLLEPHLANKTTRETSARSWLDFLLEPVTSKGRFSIPLQSQARPWLKYLILVPMMSLGSMVFAAYYWVPLLAKKGVYQYLDNMVQTMDPFFFVLMLFPVAVGILIDIGTEILNGHLLLRGRQRRHLPEHIPRLTHAVIICNYKEPLDVLRATVQSLAANTLADSTIVVLACEERDPTARETYKALEKEFASYFRSFFQTSHKLAPGEIIGKSSNENFACQELYKMVREEGLDPFQVMVTTCDADSLFDSVFLEQVEAEYCRMPDGRRFLYNAPINTYRNLPECNALVRAFEVLRCQYETFNGITNFCPAQSNYSLTLGFAHEINFWDPTNTSEDYHTTLKAMAMTGKAGNVVVKVWSLILNDSVSSFQDRWIQAKRHMWGIEEAAYVVSMFPIIRFNLWATMMRLVCFQMFGSCAPSFVILFFPPIWQVFFSLRVETQHFLVACCASAIVYNWIKMILREVFLYRYILSGRQLMMKRSIVEWLELVLFWPVMVRLASFIFVTIATWRMLIHAVFNDTLVYVTAPKALNIDYNVTADTSSPDGGIPAFIKPKKAI